MSSFNLTREKLPGGLRAVLLPRRESQTVTFLVLIGTGSRYETPRQGGLSHFLEHMFFKGTANRPTTKEIAEAIDGIGGEFNAFTGEEYTGYYVKVAASHLTTGADVVADILLNPLFPKEEIERERGVIIEETKMYTDTPMRHIHHLWQRALFGDHPLGRRIDGSEETVSAMQRSDFVGYTKKHYHAKNAVVAVAGNVKEKEVLGMLKELFADLSRGDETKPRGAPMGIPESKIVSETRDNIDQTQLMVGVPGLSLSDKQRYAVHLMGIILGGGMSSRLFLSVRERHGLAYAVRTGMESYVDAGSFVTQLGVRSDKADKALGLVIEEYDRVMNEEVSDEELKKAKEMVRGRLLLELEETNALAQFAGGQELLRKKIITPTELVRNYEAVTTAGIKKVAQRLLKPSKRAVAVLGPNESVARVKKVWSGKHSK